jgi:hypothetical protein
MKTANTIKNSHTIKDKTNKKPNYRKNPVDKSSEHKNKGETPCKS